MKCLPASKINQANGVALHDWHAEILAIRSFNRFILDECSRLARDESSESDFLRRRTQEELNPVSNKPWCRQPFAWREELTLHMYCSEAPCTCSVDVSPCHTGRGITNGLPRRRRLDGTDHVIPRRRYPVGDPPIYTIPFPCAIHSPLTDKCSQEQLRNQHHRCRRRLLRQWRPAAAISATTALRKGLLLAAWHCTAQTSAR